MFIPDLNVFKTSFCVHQKLFKCKGRRLKNVRLPKIKKSHEVFTHVNGKSLCFMLIFLISFYLCIGFCYVICI